MRAITLWQPWASAMVLGHKANETRHWNIRCQGPLLIHAAKRHIWSNIDVLPDTMMKWLVEEGWLNFEKEEDALPYGAILGKVDAVTTWETHVIKPQLSIKEIEHGNYNQFENVNGILKQRYALITENPVAFKKPIPWKGAQGFFDVPDDVVREALAT